MAVPEVLDIAIIGAGVIGPRHAESILKSSSARLACFVDPSPTADSITAEFNVPLYRSIKDLLSASEIIHGAVVCTPNSSHVLLGNELIEAGIPVLVEKPIATTIESGTELVEFAKARNVPLLIGHHRRFNPYITATRTALEDGAIGRPIAITGLWTTHKPHTYYEHPSEWRASLSQGGGPVNINLVHDIDLLQYLLGPIVRVSAERAVSQRSQTERNANAAEEGAAVLLRFASGVVGTFVLCDAVVSGHSFEAGTGENPIIPRSGKDFYRIFGSEGTLSVGDMKLSKFDNRHQKSWSSTITEFDVHVATNEVPFDLQMQHFINVIKGIEKPRCTGDEGLSALVVCNAVHLAMNENRHIDIHTPGRA